MFFSREQFYKNGDSTDLDKTEKISQENFGFWKSDEISSSIIKNQKATK